MAIPPIFVVSNVGLIKNVVLQEPEPETIDKVIEIFKARLRAKQNSLVSVVIGEADFRPFSFLQIGAKQGLSVCRIARYFSLQTFKNLVLQYLLC